MGTTSQENTPLPAEPARSQQSPKMWDRIMANGPMIAAVMVALLFCLIIGSLFWPFIFGGKDGGTLLRELSNFEVARGLITFLVAVTTVGIALILTVYVVVTQDSAAEKKFILGKEVLTGLIGVLGTIVGFYFGATNSQTTPVVPVAFKVSKVSMEPSVPKVGGKLKITVQTSGGKLPFEYVIVFKPENTIGERKGTASKETFSDEVAIPNIPVGTTVEAILSVKDKTGSPAELTTIPTVKIGQ